MGATSVTGTGPGSALGWNKGVPGETTIGVENLIGPHVVAAGVATLSAGAATVYLPFLTSGAMAVPPYVTSGTPAPQPAFCVFATDNTPGSTTPAVGSIQEGTWSGGGASGTPYWYLSLEGDTTNDVSWMVVQTGMTQI
jgi:hypothetical protein